MVPSPDVDLDSKFIIMKDIICDLSCSPSVTVTSEGAMGWVPAWSKKRQCAAVTTYLGFTYKENYKGI